MVYQLNPFTLLISKGHDAEDRNRVRRPLLPSLIKE